MSNVLKPIIFVTGKGGVGKSLLAAALATKLSKMGRKVLLVELGANTFYQQYLRLPTVEFAATPLNETLDLALWSADACLRQYVTFYVKVEKLYDIFFENRIMREIINASPALKELAILGKITSGIRRVGPALDYDHIVIDSYSTGHHRALLMAPKGISKIFQQGPMGFHSQKMVEVVRDPAICHQVVVFKPEDLPTIEALELYQFARDEFGSTPTLVCNQFLDVPGGARALSKSDHPKLVFYQKYLDQQEINLRDVKKIQRDLIQIPFIWELKTGAELVDTISKEYLDEIV